MDNSNELQAQEEEQEGVVESGLKWQQNTSKTTAVLNSRHYDLYSEIYTNNTGPLGPDLLPEDWLQSRSHGT